MRETKKKQEETFGVMDMFIFLIVMMVSSVHIHVSKFIKSYILSVCSLLYVSYTLVKVLRGKKHKIEAKITT